MDKWVNGQIDNGWNLLIKLRGSEKLTPGAGLVRDALRPEDQEPPLLSSYLALHQVRKHIIQDPSETVKKALNREGSNSEREKPWSGAAAWGWYGATFSRPTVPATDSAISNRSWALPIHPHMLPNTKGPVHRE